MESPLNKRTGNKRASVFLLMGLAWAAATAFAAEPIYRWVDSDGNVHFGDRPPAGVEATLISLALQSGGLSAQTPSEATGPGPDAQPLSPADQQRQERAERRQAALEDRRRLEQNCETMRRQREEMEPRTNVLVVGENGEPVRLDDDTRLAKLAEARAYLAEHCD